MNDYEFIHLSSANFRRMKIHKGMMNHAATKSVKTESTFKVASP